MSRLLLLNIFMIASFVILKVAEGVDPCDENCVGPAYECKDCPSCDRPCDSSYISCTSDCGPRGCGCGRGYCRSSNGDCVLEETSGAE